MLCVYVFVVFLSISLVVFPHCSVQWGTAVSSQWDGVLAFTYPIALKNRVLYAVTQEENPYAWRENQSVSVSSAFYNQGLESCQVITKTIVNGGNVLDQNSSTKVLIIGI